jgi:hypothetical protein
VNSNLVSPMKVVRLDSLAELLSPQKFQLVSVTSHIGDDTVVSNLYLGRVYRD